MRDKERNSSSSSSSPSSSSSTLSTGTESSSLIFSRGGYKVWVLAAILLLALWSMFASTITLKRTAGSLNLSSEEIESVLRNDLDVLEVEEREKVVRHMWDVYTNSKRRSSSNLGLPRFWQEAFEAAYEYLVSDDPGVRNFAVLEIAKMSMMSNDLESSPSTDSQSQRSGGAISRAKKLGEENNKLKPDSSRNIH
ncbi:unnamed protein product [Rhodiola kirilowii]